MAKAKPAASARKPTQKTKALIRDNSEASTISLGDSGELIPSAVAAPMLHVAESTLAAWRFEGTGPVYFKIGRAVFYERSDLIAWIKTQRCEPMRKAHGAAHA